MTKDNDNGLTILRRHQVEARIGLSRSTIYLRIAEGTFPTPILLGSGRAVGWLKCEIDNWINIQIEKRRMTANEVEEKL